VPETKKTQHTTVQGGGKKGVLFNPLSEEEGSTGAAKDLGQLPKERTRGGTVGKEQWGSAKKKTGVRRRKEERLSPYEPILGNSNM